MQEWGKSVNNGVDVAAKTLIERTKATLDLLNAHYIRNVAKNQSERLDYQLLFNDPKLFKNLEVDYVDHVIVHHDHFVHEILGFAHQFCDSRVRTGFPKVRLFCHNLTNFDSGFILRMIPEHVMGRRDKNLSAKWSVIAPPANSSKIKVLGTPFGTLTDSMNFFNCSLKTLGEGLTEKETKAMYEDHLRYFKTHPRWKSVLKKQSEEGRGFTLERFNTFFKGKLIFPYDSFTDFDCILYFDCIVKVKIFPITKFSK